MILSKMIYSNALHLNSKNSFTSATSMLANFPSFVNIYPVGYNKGREMLLDEHSPALSQPKNFMQINFS